MRALDHIDLSAGQILANTVATPDPSSAAPWWDGSGEVVWSSATAYTTGQYVVRTGTGRVYKALQNSTNRVPESNPLYWEDVYPINALAWGDMKTSTYTYAASPFELSVQPGVISHVNLEGLVNVDAVRLRVWDAPGGNLIYDMTNSVFWWTGDPWISYYFDMPYKRDRTKFNSVPSNASAVYELKLTSVDGTPLQVSQIAFGRFVDLGCPEFGLEWSLRTFGKNVADDFGVTTVKDGLVVVDLSGTDDVAALDANRVAEFLRKNRNRVLVWEAVDDPMYDYLSTTGVAECGLRPVGPNSARMHFRVNGVGA